MCRVCRARGLGRGARRGGGTPTDIAFVDASRPAEDDDILCSLAKTADARWNAKISSASAIDEATRNESHARPRTTRVVVGAGVAGTCCAEELCRLRPDDSVVLVTVGDAVKSVRHVERVTRNVEVLDVVERPAATLERGNLTVVNARVVGVDLRRKRLFLAESEARDSHGEGSATEETTRSRGTSRAASSLTTLAYDQLCVCTGAAPKTIPAAAPRATAGTRDDADADASEPRSVFARSVVVTVRDVESVESLRGRLETARRVLLAGNGGIAMELADGLCRREAFEAPLGDSETPGGRDATVSTSHRELLWATKHPTIGDAFFDRDAAAFLRRVAERRGGETTGKRSLNEGKRGIEKRKKSKRGERAGDGAGERAGGVKEPNAACFEETNEKRSRETESSSGGSGNVGNAAGPDWIGRLRRSVSSVAGLGATTTPKFHLRVVSDAELVSVDSFRESDASSVWNGDAHFRTPEDWPAVAILSDGSRVPVDLIVSAIGVDPAPRIDWLPVSDVPRGFDGGIRVDAAFRSVSAEFSDSVFAAGDAACCDARHCDITTQWFQMRLWSQARTSGTYVARVMVGESDADALGFNFELFTHSTRFFGKKVILLGSYNGQKLRDEDENDIAIYSRSTGEDDDGDDASSAFVRVVLLRGKMVGAVLIGDTDLAETFENLILDQIDVGGFGARLLDPDIDLADYFD
jgi:NADPH-dependent 2,4-dienoyl-CoA reductase/sulfur reductase-like enzyme